MIKIIEKVPHASVVRECICRNCGVTLSYVPKDVKESYTCDYGGGKDYYKYIKCPECLHKVTVKLWL